MNLKMKIRSNMFFQIIAFRCQMQNFKEASLTLSPRMQCVFRPSQGIIGYTITNSFFRMIVYFEFCGKLQQMNVFSIYPQVLLIRMIIYNLPKMNQSVSSIEEILHLIKTTKKHLFLVGPVLGTILLNFHDFMPNFEIITCSDPYCGALPFITVPQFLKENHQCQKGKPCVPTIISHPEVLSYMKKKDPNPNILYMDADPVTESVCKEHGINIWGPSFDLFNYLGNKVEILKLLKESEIPFIPNICSKIDDYQHFLQITSKFSTSKVVVQDQIGYCGTGTIFIQNEQQYRTFQHELEKGKEFKIMQHRNLKCFAIGGVATSTGTFIGPLLSELIGHKELTPFLGGYCGSEIRSSYFEDKEMDLRVRREIANYAIKFADFLYREKNYRGIFGFDFSVDVDTNQIFFMEMNPRLTGSNSLSFQLYEAKGHKFPNFLYHCCEYMGFKLNLDRQAINEEWIGLTHYSNEASYFIALSLNRSEEFKPYTFPAGLWSSENGILKPLGRSEYRVGEMKKDQILLVPKKGMTIINVVLRKRVQDYNFKLTEEAKEMIKNLIEVRLGEKRQLS